MRDGRWIGRGGELKMGKEDERLRRERKKREQKRREGRRKRRRRTE